MSKEIGMMSSFSAAQQGPVVSHEVTKLSFDFEGFTPEWLTDPLQIVHDTAATIGEANRAWLHERLDKYLDRLLATGSGKPAKGEEV